MSEDTSEAHFTPDAIEPDPKNVEQSDVGEKQEPDVYGELEPAEHVAILVRSSDDIIKGIGLYDKPAVAQPEGEETAAKSAKFQKLSSKWLEFSLGFFETAPLLEGMADFLHMSKAKEETLAFLKKVAVRTIDNSSGQSDAEDIYLINKRDIGVYNQRLAELVRFQRQTKVYTESFILSLIAQYEVMVADTLRFALADQPKIYISSEVKINAVDVINAMDIEGIKRKIIEEKLEVLLRDSHINLVQDFFKRLSLDLPDKILLKDFGEICERRNLITHADGVVNARYRMNLKKLGFSESDIPTVGTSLHADVGYIVSSNARTTLLGFWIIHSVWRKLFPQETKTADASLNEAVHDFLVAGYTKMARRLCEFALEEFPDIKEEIRAYLVVNLCLSYLLEDDMEEAERRKGIDDSLQKRDWGILNAPLALALCCIKEDYDQLSSKIDDAVHHGLTVQEFSTWALFSKVRSLPLYKEKMMEHFRVTVTQDASLIPEEHSNSSSNK